MDSGLKKIKVENVDLLFIVSISVFGLILRILLMRYQFTVSFDEINYLKLGISGSMNGLSHVFHTYWSPFYPLVVALVSKFTTNYELAGRLISVLTGILVVPLVFYFARSHFDRKIARYGATFLALYPALAFFSTRAQTEPLYTLLITAGIFLGWRALTKKSYWLNFIVGLLFGMAYLTKPEGIGFIIVYGGILGLLLIFALVKKDHTFRVLTISLLAVVGFVISAAPYIFYLKQTTGQWTISAKGKANQQFEAHSSGLSGSTEDVFRKLNSENTQVPIDQIYHIGTFIQAEQTRGTPTVKVSPLIVVRKYIENLYKVLTDGINHALTTIILMLVVLGLLADAWSKQRAWKELYLLSYIVFFWLVVIPLFHINDRYFVPLLPLCFIWVGKGFVFMNDWLQKTLVNFFDFSNIKLPPGRVASSLLILLLFLGLYLPQLGKIVAKDRWTTEYWADPVEQKIAGLWIKAHSEKTPVIMSRGHTVDFYAGNYNIAETVTIPKNDLSRVLEYAKFRGVDYLVLNERYAVAYPEIRFLLDEENIPAELQLVFKFDKRPGLKTVVYQLN